MPFFKRDKSEDACRIIELSDPPVTDGSKNSKRAKSYTRFHTNSPKDAKFTSVSQEHPERPMSIFRDESEATVLDPMDISFDTQEHTTYEKPGVCGRLCPCCSKQKYCCCCNTRKKCVLINLCCVLSFVLLLVLIVVIGSAVEQAALAEAPGTGWVYTTKEVCTRSGNSFGSVGAAHNASQRVLHCGPCGACSNTHDIDVYNKTLETLTDTTTRCAMKSFFGADPVTQCMNEKVGMTEACTKCWVENVMCDQQKCKWTCLKYFISGEAKNVEGKGQGELNPCLKCDERMCGPAFIRCVGVNRRRSGIVSDIARDTKENCDVVDPPAPAT